MYTRQQLQRLVTDELNKQMSARDDENDMRKKIESFLRFDLGADNMQIQKFWQMLEGKDISEDEELDASAVVTGNGGRNWDLSGAANRPVVNPGKGASDSYDSFSAMFPDAAKVKTGTWG